MVNEDSNLGTSPSPSQGGGQNVVYKYVTANPKNYRLIKLRRDELKKNPTPAEDLLWSYLKNKSTGHRIRRQHIIETFIVDFVCLKKELIIEVDGKIHEKQKEYDDSRTEHLNLLGYKVIRFTNEEVIINPELVVKKIKNILNTNI